LELIQAHSGMTIQGPSIAVALNPDHNEGNLIRGKASAYVFKNWLGSTSTSSSSSFDAITSTIRFLVHGGIAFLLTFSTSALIRMGRRSWLYKGMSDTLQD
jgi:hypothetical protein